MLVQLQIHLIVQYYHAATPERQKEIDTCLRQNLLNPHIAVVHLLTEEQFDLSGFPCPEKICQTVIGIRLTYEQAFHYANEWSTKPVIWILANADIYFDDTLRFLHDADLTNTVFALTRHDVQLDGRIKPVPREYAHGCQDAWVFTTPLLLDGMNTKFYLGIPGCDNRIVYELILAGYIVLNPSLTITARHLDLCRIVEIEKRIAAYVHMRTAANIAAGKVAPPPYLGEIYPTQQLNVSNGISWDHHRAVLSDFAKHVRDIDNNMITFSNSIAKLVSPLLNIMIPIGNAIWRKVMKR